MTDNRTASERMRRAVFGDTRTDVECASDGAKVTISQIDKLRNQLDQAERCCQHVLTTGRLRHDDEAVWKRVGKAMGKLMQGME